MENKKSVNVRYSNRPVKVAFIVPLADDTTQWVLDGIFNEAYSRWGGVKSLLIPFSSDDFIPDRYLDWLERYDADFVYSYVDLTPDQINIINEKSLPIEMIKHEVHGEVERWNQFIPSWPYGFVPIRAISTINSPYSKYQGWSNESQPNMYITQHYENDEYRFLPDNFGISQGGCGSNLGRQNIFGTVCYCAQDLPTYNNVGNERCHSLAELLGKLAQKQVKTFSTLSNIHASTINHPNDYEWSNSFNLFVGDTAADRLNFWNSRLLSENNERHDFSALCISKDYLDDDKFLIELGAFINAHNFKGHGNGPSSLSLRSLSVAKEDCQQLAQQLQNYTYSHVTVPGKFDSPALPSERALSGHYSIESGRTRSIKVYERDNKFVVDEVEHFKYLTPDLYDFKTGQCVSNLYIEKPKENYVVVGDFNDWKLPRRLEATLAFTKNRAKVSRHGSITVIPDAPQQNFHGIPQHELTITLSIPSEEEVLRCIVLEHTHRIRFERDMRMQLATEKYYDLELSDKGQKHRGVISLFNGDLSHAGILANSYWRKIVRRSIENDKVSFSLDKLTSIIDQNTPVSLEHITEQMRLGNVGKTKQYLKNNLKDTIEYLVHQNILTQEYRWRCPYCGNENGLTLDTIKLDNNCSICNKLHKTPIDMEWKYKVSPFITSALIEQNGLTVLWAIDHLMDVFRRTQAFYLPEVNLFKNRESNENNEIDLLAVIDGRFVAAEVKLSAASFVDNPHEVTAFIDEIQRLSPDIAFLICEQYCQEQVDVDEYKAKIKEVTDNIREKVTNVEVKVIVANEVDSFIEVPTELGPYGERTHAFFERLDE
ncbi:hypothetical protein H320_15415 [Vibrio parahaemolyticus 49]|nr:hypothetical protein [Vibrio parahaemolyticus]KIT42493.1 hypothetical protein H320_15415 [Vibrio parahaemolyticus 49]EGQ8883821.1 hypothetical protein [Vibrio parahaemolyticus]EGQ8913285.1 hypothetical protein [Vibrio parahaemolyticus]EGQ8933000.1 hypothetical protein [Vibrio parahaemolyticus]